MKQETSVEIRVTISANQDEYNKAVKFISDTPMRAHIDQQDSGNYELTFYHYTDWNDFRRKFRIEWVA